MTANTRRVYAVAYRADNGNVCTISTPNTPTSLREYAEQDAEAMRSPEDQTEVFVAYRDLPEWVPADSNAGYTRLRQPFDADGNFVCARCREPVGDFDLYVEVRQRDILDDDSRLAVHIRCLLTMESLDTASEAALEAAAQRLPLSRSWDLDERGRTMQGPGVCGTCDGGGCGDCVG